MYKEEFCIYVGNSDHCKKCIPVEDKSVKIGNSLHIKMKLKYMGYSNDVSYKETNLATLIMLLNIVQLHLHTKLLIKGLACLVYLASSFMKDLLLMRLVTKHTHIHTYTNTYTYTYTYVCIVIVCI